MPSLSEFKYNRFRLMSMMSYPEWTCAVCCWVIIQLIWIRMVCLVIKIGWPKYGCVWSSAWLVIWLAALVFCFLLSMSSCPTKQFLKVSIPASPIQDSSSCTIIKIHHLSFQATLFRNRACMNFLGTSIPCLRFTICLSLTSHSRHSSEWQKRARTSSIEKK